MKYLVITIALFSGAYGFSQVESEATTKVVVKEESKEFKKQPKKKAPKATKIDRPVIDKYTKPREVSAPKKENK